MSADTIPKRLFEQAKTSGARPAYFTKEGDGWKATNWTDFAAEVRQAARALVTLGFEANDTVSILGFNRPEWTIFDLAAMTAGGAPAGVYTTCSATEVAYIVSHADAKIMLVEDEGQLDKVRERKADFDNLAWVVTMKGAPSASEDWVLSWDEFLAKAEDTEDSVIDDRLDALEPSQLATLIYTSGTTGPPKGVMLSHENIAWTAKTTASMVENTPEDCGLSYLPLSHIAEQMFTIHGPITTGSSVYYAESIEKVPDNLKEVQPTVFFGVPRIWEKFYARLSEGMGQATGFKKSLVKWVRKVCTERNRRINAGRSPGARLNFQYKIANKLVLSKLKPKIGLGNARICVSGAAPIAPEILEFMSSIDVVINEVYGQSEDCGPTSFNKPGNVKYGTVGPPFAGVEVKIAEDGEILVSGKNVFLGYYKDQEATDETLIDGWLHSGDLGEIDTEGFLRITGRKKDIIITAGGKNVAPKNIEGGLKNNRLINEAVVIGDRRKFLSALVTIDEEALVSFASESGKAIEVPHEDEAVKEEIERAFRNVNKDLAQVEKIKKWTILPRNLSIEDGELTPTLKVKRRVVNEHFADEIEAMYQ